MRAFGGGGSRESACRRFRDAEGTRRGWNFGRCEPLVRQRDCLPTRVDASRLCGPRDAVVIARSVRHRRPSLSPFRAGKPHPQFLAAGASGERPGLSCVAGSTRCRRWRPRCARRSRARASRSSPGRRARRSRVVRCRRAILVRVAERRARARLGAAPPQPRAAVPARARRGSRALARARTRGGSSARTTRYDSRASRARTTAPVPRARARSSAIAGGGPALARRLLVDARVLHVPRGGRASSRARAPARRAGVGARLRARRLGRLGVGPRARRHERGARGRRGHPRALVDVDGVDDDVNDDAPVAARAACDSPRRGLRPGRLRAPEAWSLAQLTLANADAAGAKLGEAARGS